MIYADYNGSCPIHPKVKEYLVERIQNGPYANPNAIHSMGRKMRFGLEKCRSICAKLLGAKTTEVSFNSGSSEGISHVFHSVLSDRKDNKNIIVTSGIEHSCVINAALYYQEARGFKVLIVPTLANGVIDLNELKKICEENKDKIALVSIMAANNETGVIQPYKEIGKLAHSAGALYFGDTTQYIGKTEFNFAESEMDFAVLSGHKVGAIIGSGILLTKDGIKMKPLVFGGAIQEFGIRGGTQNYIGAETLAVALEAFNQDKLILPEIQKYKDKFEKNLKTIFPDLVIVGEDAPRLATTTGQQEL